MQESNQGTPRLEQFWHLLTARDPKKAGVSATPAQGSERHDAMPEQLCSLVISQRKGDHKYDSVDRRMHNTSKWRGLNSPVELLREPISKKPVDGAH